MSDVQITIGNQDDAQVISASLQETQIVSAVPGIQGPVGQGFPSGGTANQVLFKQSSTSYDAVWGFVTSSMIGDLEIVNADVASGAAIDLTKLANGALPSGITIASANIEGLLVPTLDNVQVVYSGGLIVGASYPSGSPYDYVSVVYSGGLLSQMDYREGGANGGAIATFVVGYSGSTVTGISRTL